MSGERDLRLLQEGGEALGVSLEPGVRDRLLRYLDLLYIWNKAAGLTTIPPDAAVRLHLLDSLGALSSVGPGRCLDLGTGAGLPGVVLAVARPALDVVLVESNRKKCSFLLEVARTLGLSNVRVCQTDADTLAPGEKYPTVISRAFRQPVEFLRTARELIAPEGTIVLMMANPTEEELRRLAEEAGLVTRSSRRFVLPGGEEPRTVAEFALPDHLR